MYYIKLKQRLIECSKMRIPITREDRIKYQEIFETNPANFTKNATRYYFMNMRGSIRTGKVWRNNISGRVRHGKSEVAQTWIMLYIDEHNIAIELNCFNKLKEQGIDYNVEKLTPLSYKDILFSQSNYLYLLREEEKEDKLVYGKPRIVDEDQQSTGGIGSYSEKLEIDNINNITAQAVQSEYQLRPDRFVLLNAPFGLHQEKMDRENKINWSMLYEFNTEPLRTKDYIFKGWVATPLHEEHDLRKLYNISKKENIKKVIKGTADLRLLERHKVSKLLSENEYFKSRTINGKTFKYSKTQQESILNEMIINGDFQNFNAIEKEEIVDYARLLAEREYENANKKK